MEGFTINSETAFITVNFEEVYGFPYKTCHWGGYEVRTTLEIKSGNFIVKSTFWTSTGEIFEFFQLLKKCNNELKGSAVYRSYEDNLKIFATYDDLGHVNIKGNYFEHSQFDNRLYFHFVTDQTFIRKTVEELEIITNKYGDMKGIKRTTNA